MALLLWAALTGAFAAGAGENAVSVEVFAGEKGAAVSPYLVNGFNYNHSMQVYTIRDLIEKLNIATITYPGGNIGDEQDIPEYDLSFFRTQQQYLGMPFTFYQVRLFGGTPEKAAETVRLVKRLGIRVDVWTIGNEPDLYASKRSDPSWTPQKYNRLFREYAAALKAVDPDIRLSGPGVSQPKDRWVRSFIQECGDLVDVLTWHFYPADESAPVQKALETAAEARRFMRLYTEWLKDPLVNVKGHDRKIMTGVTEWAIHPETGRTRLIAELPGALWAAEVMGIYAEEGLDFSHYFCLNQWGGHAIFNKRNKPRPLYYLFAMYAQHFGTTTVASRSGDGAIGVNASMKGDSDITLFLVNRDPEKARPVNVAVSGFPRIRFAEGWVLTEEKENVQIPHLRIIKLRDRVLLELEPFSVTVLRIYGE